MTDLMSKMNVLPSGKDLAKGGSEILSSMGMSLDHMSERGIETIKKYPLHTTLAASVIGFVAGAIVARK
jgi:hypothetical protein